MAMATPKLKVGRLGIEYVAKGCVAIVAGARKHGKALVYFSGKEHSITIERKKSILKLMERFEIGGPCHANGRAMVSVAPCHVVAVVDEGDAWVIAIHPFTYFRIIAVKMNGVGVNLPSNAIVREANMKCHASVLVVAAGYSSISVAKGYYGRIEDGVAVGKQVAGNNGVL